MTRVTINPRRNLENPLVEIDPAASRWERAGSWLMRGYIAFLVAFYAVALTFLLAFMVVVTLD